MNEEEARKHVKALQFFYGHLALFTTTMFVVSGINLLTYLNGFPKLWAAYVLFSWGPLVLLNWLGVSGRIGGGKNWEEQKIRELTGWSATQEELTRLSERVETLLTIISDVKLEDFDPSLVTTNKSLLNAKEIIEVQQTPTNTSDQKAINKNDIVTLIERLEMLVTSAEFQHFENTKINTEPKEPDTH